MAASGYTPISLYYSSTPTQAPSGSNLVYGELAINIYDGKLYYKDSSNVVQLLAGKGGAGVVAGSNTQVQYNNNGVFGASPNFTFDGTNIGLAGGTANGVAYLNGSKVLTTGSALTFDGTTLAVTGSATVTGDISTTSTGRLNVRGSGTGVNYDLQIDNSDTLVNFRASRSNAITKAYAWYLDNSVTEGMRLTSTGLGIGTSSPSYKIDVASNVNGDAAINISNNSTGANASSIFRATNGSYAGYFGVNGTNATAAGVLQPNIAFARGSAGFSLCADTGNITFGSVSAERMRLDSSGNLGLGVTPSAWSDGKAIEVGGAGNSVWGNGANSLQLMTNAYYNGGFKYAGTGLASRYVQYDGIHAWYNATSGTAGNAITFTQAMTLDASGNLGVNTSLPLAKIAVDDGSIKVGNTSNTTQTYSIIGGYGYRIGSTEYGAVSIRSSYLNTNNTGTLDFYTGGSERMRIASNGLVGIGTSSPLYDVQILNTSATLALGGAPTVNGTGRLKFINSTTQKNWQISFNDNVGGALEFARSTAAGGSTFTTPDMIIDPSGNVGIGTNTPNAQLEIYTISGSNTYGNMRLVGSNRGGQLDMYNQGYPVARFESDQSGNISFYGSKGFNQSSLTSLMVIDSTGNVTIAQAGRATITTDNDGSFDMNAASNFKCTPTGTFALTFTNIASAGGQSGYILLVNTGGYAITAAATTKVGSSFLSTVSTAGTYLLSYFSDATNVYVTTSGALS